MRTKELMKKFPDIIFMLLLLYFTFFPNEAGIPAYEAIVFCVKNLVPHIFIYILLSKAVISSFVFRKCAEFFGTDSACFILGTLCGCPNGAKNAKALFDCGAITKKQAEYLCTFTNNPSVSFVIGFVGISLFGSLKVGIFLLLCEIISALTAKFIMKKIMFGREKKQKAVFPVFPKPNIYEIMSDSAFTLINICMNVILFRIIGNSLIKFLPQKDFIKPIADVILEFSSGCESARDSGVFALPLCGFSLGFSGLSVFLQTKSAVGNAFSLKPYLCSKIFQGAMCAILCAVFG